MTHGFTPGRYGSTEASVAEAEVERRQQRKDMTVAAGALVLAAPLVAGHIALEVTRNGGRVLIDSARKVTSRIFEDADEAHAMSDISVGDPDYTSPPAITVPTGRTIDELEAHRDSLLPGQVADTDPFGGPMTPAFVEDIDDLSRSPEDHTFSTLNFNVPGGHRK